MSLPVQLDILRLASSYHSSDYNRARFGSNGSPVPYLPLSPHMFTILRQRQLSSAHRQSWWPASTHPATLQLDLNNNSSHPINISSIIPPESTALIASHALLAPSGAPTILEIPSKFTLFSFSPTQDTTHFDHLSSPIFQTRLDLANAISAAIASSLPHRPSSSSLPPTPNTTHSLSIGNLFLSSCPGKKVRLHGPVNGRSAVCRDLHVDIARMRRLGVSCIICCLDDDELEFLGAPWQEYEQCANKNGIDVLRLPTPEGLPPATSASQLDGYLVDIINRYSLRGQSILVHCRGGVGRAGVFACCWMIRLGLCGWPEHVLNHSLSTDNKDSDPALNLTINNDQTKEQHPTTIDFVKSVIALIRRRRSIKAIETYEQVEFLVDYVEHLRNLFNDIPFTEFDGLHVDCTS